MQRGCVAQLVEHWTFNPRVLGSTPNAPMYENLRGYIIHMLYTPLEQFQVVALLPVRIGSLDLSFTNTALFTVVVFSAILFFLGMPLINSKVVPTRWQSVPELMYEFVVGVIKENVGPRGMQYFPFIFVLFAFILFCNLVGMVPYSYTVTSHLIITCGFSVSIFLGVTLIGLVRHKVHFFSFFMPPGVSIVAAPFLVLIELVSYLARAVSLGVRLFANMMSGHTLVKILAGFGWTMLTSGGFFMLLSIFPVLVVLAVTGLEIGVALIQAYVFTILTCLYIKDAFDLH
jgi:ATP synthase subunit 6